MTSCSIVGVQDGSGLTLRRKLARLKLVQSEKTLKLLVLDLLRGIFGDLVNRVIYDVLSDSLIVRADPSLIEPRVLCRLPLGHAFLDFLNLDFAVARRRLKHLNVALGEL